MSYNRPPYRRSSGLPSWLVFIIAIALVMGGYYLWLGLQNFLQTSGLGVVEATQRAELIDTATAQLRPTQRGTVMLGATLLPTPTPIPECMDFTITANIAILRSAPSQTGEVLAQLPAGEVVCVLGDEERGEFKWYLIDQNRRTNRIEEAYMREDLLEAVNPTLTPSQTMTPAPTVTDMPTATPTETPEPSNTPTRDPSASDTPRPTPTPSYTPAMQSA